MRAPAMILTACLASAAGLPMPAAQAGGPHHRAYVMVPATGMATGFAGQAVYPAYTAPVAGFAAPYSAPPAAYAMMYPANGNAWSPSGGYQAEATRIGEILDLIRGIGELTRVFPPSPGPDPTNLQQRVAALEADVRQLKAICGGAAGRQPGSDGAIDNDRLSAQTVPQRAAGAHSLVEQTAEIRRLLQKQERMLKGHGKSLEALSERVKRLESRGPSPALPQVPPKPVQ